LVGLPVGDSVGLPVVGDAPQAHTHERLPEQLAVEEVARLLYSLANAGLCMHPGGAHPLEIHRQG